ncbi:DUF1700 domain-containing protein [Clostridium polynesiense]|uniref:DUF1700 domain-containing protein n=1 Tax=Clostridium polynesiense TaxID=1325933 RepID=UPI00058F3303|nr:DUF1700 domain-containing protein [Clostridium polynesiense]
MKKSDFLSILEANLSGYPETSVEIVLNKYRNKFKDAESKGISEDDFITSLGDPYIIAQSCIKNMDIISEEITTSHQESFSEITDKTDISSVELPSMSVIQSMLSKFFKTIFSILGFIFFLIMSLPLFFVLLTLFLASILVSLSGVAIAGSVIFAPHLVNLPFKLPESAMFFGILGVVILGIIVFILGILMLKFNYGLMKKLGRKIGYPLNGKESD